MFRHFFLCLSNFTGLHFASQVRLLRDGFTAKCNKPLVLVLTTKFNFYYLLDPHSSAQLWLFLSSPIGYHSYWYLLWWSECSQGLCLQICYHQTVKCQTQSVAPRISLAPLSIDLVLWPMTLWLFSPIFERWKFYSILSSTYPIATALYTTEVARARRRTTGAL